MKIFGQASLYDLFQENIIYRNLDIIDIRYPKFYEIKNQLHIQDLPRKNSKDYASVVLSILRSINPDVDSVLYFGDSQLDIALVQNIFEIQDIEVRGFIYSSHEYKDLPVYYYKSWEKIFDFITCCKKLIGQNTIAVFDLDKTIIGAKGRNESVINDVRFDAVYEQLKNLENSISRDSAKRIYDILQLNHADYTQDNQDTTALLTILIAHRIIDFDKLDEFKKGNVKLTDLTSLAMLDCDNDLLKKLTAEIQKKLSKRSPTFFIPFRESEFKATIARFNRYPKEKGVEFIVNNEITITKEICDAVHFLNNNSVTCVCLSDKPDEAVFPASSANGKKQEKPLHLKQAKIVGNEIESNLKKLTS
ncbi:hypothetical protein ACFL67_04445 [candidate division KSB1 bacterium]